MDLFHFDIETSSAYPSFESFQENDEKGAELFDRKFHKMKWVDTYESINDAYLDQAGIISTYGRICCISFGYINNEGHNLIKSFYGEDEEEIVKNFNNLLLKIETKSFNLSGYRILYFDIPWILHKLHKYGIKPANIIYLYNKKPWETRITDMAEDWKLKFAWTSSFDEVCYELGVDSPKDKMAGNEVTKKYWEGNYEEIKEYCEKDVIASIEVSKKIY